MNLPPCVHRGSEVSPRKYFCRSDRLIFLESIVSGEFCATRCPYPNVPRLRPDGFGDAVHKIMDFTGGEKLAHAVMKFMGIDPASCGCGERLVAMNAALKRSKDQKRWAAGVTTAPRSAPTVNACLTSMISNGWAPTAFAEPDSPLDDVRNALLPIVQRLERFGAWSNWVSMCRVLLEAESEWVFTVQDDAVFVPGAREWFEKNPPPDDFGMASLYTPAHYQRKFAASAVGGWRRVRTKSLWGACAMVFKREVLGELLDHPFAKSWGGAPFKTRKRPREPWEVGNVDTAVGKLMRKMGLPVYFVMPSLCQHVATTSAMGHGGNTGNRRASVVGLPAT